ncbi:MAG: biopolymer transporter ExbD [Alkalinema sp. CAN_BIN05]|nr:biopolymer transporter ExbD [Alkalinema sp. CAN_BIN05]
MRTPQEFDRPVEVSTTLVPLMDVVFAILTFFIMSTLYLTKSEGLIVNLPKAAQSQSQQQTRMNVTVMSDGTLALNKQIIPLDQLEANVRSLMIATQQTVVIINADTAVNHGNVVAVLDQVKKIDGVKVAIATKK